MTASKTPVNRPITLAEPVHGEASLASKYAFHARLTKAGSFNLDSGSHYHYITPMIVSVRHNMILFSLLLVWVCSSGLQLIAHWDTGPQSSFKAEQHKNPNQKAIAEIAHSQKRDTVRRDHPQSISLRVYSSHVPLLAVQTPVTPNGQTANRASSRPLHQKISLSLI